MRLVNHAQKFISEHITQGSTALDLTCGNGYDSLFLAQKVGSRGMLYSIDIQSYAIQKARDLLRSENCNSQTKFILSCHTKLSGILPSAVKGKVSAIMLNLGYLPGGDRQIMTMAETTISAVSHAYDWLSYKGGMTILVYRGHKGGQEENLAVKNLILRNEWNCKIELGNQKNDSPILYMISKIRRD